MQVTHINTCEYVDALHSQQTEPYQIGKSNILFQPLWYKNSISNCIRAKQTLKVILPKQAYQMGLVRKVYLNQANSWQQQRQIIVIKLKNTDNNILKFSC